MKSINLVLLNILFLFILGCNSEDISKGETFIDTSDFEIAIIEYPEKDQVIGVVQASTNKGNIIFSINSQTPNDSFTIDSETGELKVLNETHYNYDLNHTITGIVELRNGDVTNYSNITISIVDVIKVYKGSIEIRSQSEVEIFGANHYDRIEGDLMLYFESITDISCLSSIKFIDGAILVMGTHLENIDGLSNANIHNDGIIMVVNNPFLKNIDGLNGVTARLGFLEIRGSLLLKNIDALSNILGVNSIDITATGVTNLAGLANISNPLESLSITDNPDLVDTDGLSNIPKITGSFAFRLNPGVISLSNMKSLTEVKYLQIWDNDLLENIDGLSELETCLELSIQYNKKLKNIDGFIKLATVRNGCVSIVGNASLSDFCGLSLLSTFPSNEYYIRNNLYNPTKNDINSGNCSI